jgi:electron transfer flavoprotein alpha subunit
MLTRTISKISKPQLSKDFSTLLLTTPLTKNSPILGSSNLSALNCSKAVSQSEPIHVLTPAGPSFKNFSPLTHKSIATSTVITHDSFENPTSSSLLTYL